MYHRPLTCADRYGAPRNDRKVSEMLGGSGHYAPGTHKCSVCQEFKTEKDFNAEEAGLQALLLRLRPAPHRPRKADW